MDKGKEKGILKLETRPRVLIDPRSELTPQGSYEHGPVSPQPSVDRLSVTWADPGSMASSGVNLFHLPSDTPVSNEVKFSPSAGDGSDDEDYSASLSAVLRQRRASVRRSRKGRARRPSSPFLADEGRARRRSSVFTTSSGDTAISMEEGQPQEVTQEQIFENIHLHKEVLGSVKQQPLGMRRKLKIVHQAKAYIKRHEGQLQERLAQSKSTRDIYARFNILLATKWHQMKREAANTSNLLIPWELRIKEIESHFGSVVASYFTFLRWLFWVNLVIGFILLVFVIIPEETSIARNNNSNLRLTIMTSRAPGGQTTAVLELTMNLIRKKIDGVGTQGYKTRCSMTPICRQNRYPLTMENRHLENIDSITSLNNTYVWRALVYPIIQADPKQDGQRKIIEESVNATNLLTLWEFEGVLKYSPIFYGYYSNIARPQYWMPLAYFLTGLVVYIYSFVAILRKMAENSRMSKLSEKEDECIFSWKLFTGWDFMIGNAETAHNRIASVILGFKEALLEEAEKKKDLRNWRIISLRGLVNICVIILLAVSAYAVVTVVSRSDDNPKSRSWWRENETTIVVTLISITFPVFFELLGFLEHYHPRKQLRLQLARIMLLNLLNLYSLIFALFSKIEGMSSDLDALKPQLFINASYNNITKIEEDIIMHISINCHEEPVVCEICVNDWNELVSATTTEGFTNNITDTLPKSFFLTNKTNTTEFEKSHTIPLINSTLEFSNYPLAENLLGDEIHDGTTTLDTVSVIMRELERLRNISGGNEITTTSNEATSEILYDYDSIFDEFNSVSELSTKEAPTSNNNVENYSVSASSTSLHYDYNNRETIENIPTTLASNTISNTMKTDISSEYYSTVKNDITETTLNSYNDTESTSHAISGQSEVSTVTDKSYIFTNQLTITTLADEIESYDTTTLTDFTEEIKSDKGPTSTETQLITEIPQTVTLNFTICPKHLNYTLNCNGHNITQVFEIYKCIIVKKTCYKTVCEKLEAPTDKGKRNETMLDIVYLDEKNRKMYNLTDSTKKKLLKLCWETMFGQELVKLTMMDLVFVLLGTLFMDFFRALFVRYMNRCWCWDLEKKFPEYGDFKIAENILHLINNQGMVWMGMFFSPGLVVLNVAKLMIMMYLRSWAVMTCNVPHEVVFRVSKSNNFYLALLLTMLFLCVLPVGYTIVWVKPSWHCGPFSEYDKIYYILTNNIYNLLPKSLNFALEYIASPAIVIPLLVLLILIIYYLISLTNSLREANNDLKIQLRRERTEERRKMFQLADTRRRVGSSAMENTPFARWKKALPSLPLSKSIDSDDRKTITGDESSEPRKIVKKRGGIFAKIVGMAVDKKPNIESVTEIISEVNNRASSPSNNIDDETDTDFHEKLPKEVLKIKDIIFKNIQMKKKSNVEFKTQDLIQSKFKPNDASLKVNTETDDDLTEKKAVLEKQKRDLCKGMTATKPKSIAISSDTPDQTSKIVKKLSRKQTSESSNLSKQSDSIGSVIPVITISTTESDEELLQPKHTSITENLNKVKKSSTDSKSLRRQSSVDSMNEQKLTKEKKVEVGEGYKYQYSL